ncbi:MAG TPA: isoleucine--tRNA ligase [Mycobacteriales bacterium]
MPLQPLPPHVDLPALEHEVIARWQHADVVGRALTARTGGQRWTFYEGPPTANGKPGTHHMEARSFKDLFCRYRTMRGYDVPRRAGWDCHGLPVELAVEKELGFTSKHDIEAYGIAEFNARCRESVLRHVADFEAMSNRMAFWLDYAHAYRTMDSAYVESVWWSLATLWRKGLLSESYRVTPYCPRCETALSDHEVAQGYATVTDPSVYFHAPATSGPLADLGASLLVWTSLPWTIYPNTLIAVNPEVTYQAVRISDGNVFVVAEPLVEAVLGTDVEVLGSWTGRELEGTTYQRFYDVPGIHDGATPAHFVALADYVTVDSGTGLVGQSPAFGADDMATAERYQAPVVNPVDRSGHFTPGLPLVGGRQIRDCDGIVLDDLDARGLVLRREPYEHSFPLCWRCDTPLVYYAIPSWYVRTTAAKDALLRENAKTDWHPETIRTGRYGDWLENNVDWALSRNRYWGTPLPLWRCGNGHITPVESLTDLSQRAGRDLADLDPHRPFVDEVTVPCADCGETARRVEEVIDCWYDAGAMPFAQWGAPHRGDAEFTASYPAQFIAEGLDQTRGWFYTLMAIGTLVFDRSAYESVLCLGIILAEDGRRMSKHFGNILEPMALMERHGADAVRWFMLAGGSPWGARRVGSAALDEVTRKVLLTTWSTASFHTLYADACGWSPAVPGPEPADRPALDRWALAELADTVSVVTAALDAFDPTSAGRRIAGFVDDLSNWYVRRSRRRFWAGDPAALATLHECLTTLARLLAPFTPFLADQLWHALVVATDDTAPDSVHLADWPAAGADDAGLRAEVGAVRRLVELGRSARAESAVPTRQPLREAVVSDPVRLGPDLLAELADELNVRSVRLIGQTEALTTTHFKPNFRGLGKRFGNETQAWAQEIRDQRVTRTAPGRYEVTLEGRTEVLGAEEVEELEAAATGYAVTTAGSSSVALDLTVTPELRRAGLARAASRAVNEARKAAGLDVTDRIELWWESDDAEMAQALTEHADAFAADVLAVIVTGRAPTADLSAYPSPELHVTFWLRAAGG